jgi:hypothetical protein
MAKRYQAGRRLFGLPGTLMGGSTTKRQFLMDRKLKGWLVASILLWPFLAAGLAACLARLPTTDPTDPFTGPHDPYHNWVGQGVVTAYGNALLFLLIIYACKFLIGRLPVRWVRVYWFVLLVLASLPCIWLLVVLDWQNPHVYRVACWVHYPIGFWFIPAVSFAADTVAMRTPGLRWYVGRSCVELLLLVPWVYLWGFFSFFILGGGWI